MPYTRKQVEALNFSLIQLLGDQHSWQWEAQRGVILSEFARDKIEPTLATLRASYEHEWDKKNIKKAPKELKEQLGELAVLYKEQKLFTREATEDTPASVAIWWPWGHGGTVSLRVKPLGESYPTPELNSGQGVFFRIKQLFS